MPYINVRILGEATEPQKRAVVEDITRSMMVRLGKSPEHIHIVIDEIPPANWGFAGKLTKDFVAQKQAHDTPRPADGSRESES